MMIPDRKVSIYPSAATFLEEVVFPHAHITSSDHDDDASSSCSPSIRIIIVCSTRERFREQLFTSMNDSAVGQGGHRHGTTNTLLTKTIGVIAMASNVRLVFCPTVESLRAYIASSSNLRGALDDSDPGKKQQNSQGVRQGLAVLNLLALHHYSKTAEFSAQGLSRTLASVVELAARVRAELVLCECADAGENALWDAQVPLLSGSVDNNVGSVPVRRILQRWFDIVNQNGS